MGQILFDLKNVIHVTNDHCTVERNSNLEFVQSGAATCSEGFVICFLKVAPACLGSMAVAEQPKDLRNSQKTLYKTFGTSFRPRAYKDGHKGWL